VEEWIMARNVGREQIQYLVDEHEKWRSECINLIASENVLSACVKRYLSCDLVQRYGDYVGRDFAARKYQGTRWLEQIEELVTDLAAELYGARYAELRAISGHVAGSAVITALTKPGDVILEVSREIGSHRMAYKLGQTPAMPLKVCFLPFDPCVYNIAVDKAVQMIKETKPRMVILGSSNFLFPHPVRELAAALQTFPETILVYDASHVFGLVAGRRFQDPVAEGAHVVFGSTHKTLPGPQGGLILSDNVQFMEKIAEAIYPALVTNHHPFRLPALGIALLELKHWGTAYADQTIANAQHLAAAINAKGVTVVSSNGRFTESHTILLQVAPFGAAQEVATELEKANIIVSAAHLPAALGREGIRVGVQEITRLGAKEDDMESLSTLITDVLMGTRSSQDTVPLAREYASQFRTVHFTWE
jgi:glycine hydroxymethyltransferase